MRTVFSWWFLRCIATLVAASVIFAASLGLLVARAANISAGQEWARPAHMALKKIGPLGVQSGTPVLFSNLDCVRLTYRLVAKDTMREGCFSRTAFGLMETDDQVVIFEGTDEGLPLEAYGPHDTPVPWPESAGMPVLTPLNTGGSRLGLYSHPLAALTEKRDALGRLTAKKLSAAPDLTIKDGSGRPLVINPQTLAFSQGGGWLAAETLAGSFVRVDLSSRQVTPFAPAYVSTGGPAPLKSQVAVSSDGSYIAVANDYAAEFKVYDLTDCGAAYRYDRRDMPPLDCPWHDYHRYLASKIPGLRGIRRLRFVNDGLLSFEAVSSDGSRSGLYELAPSPDIGPLTGYIGLGDSYTSG